MMFYVNAIKVDNGGCIGLFSANSWRGTGNIHDENKADYYTDTTLIASGVQLSGNSVPNFSAPFDGGISVENKHYDIIQIVDKKYERCFHADNTEDAIAIFKAQCY